MSLKYHLVISSPQNSAVNVPTTKNGPKGIMLFIFFLPTAIRYSPAMDPKIKEEKTANKIAGHPKIIPIKKPNFTSPPPIPLPLVKRTIAKKNPPARNAANR